MLTPRRLVLVFLLGILTDFIVAAYMVCVAKNWIVAATFTAFLCPYTVLVETAWFADATTMRDRMRLTTAAAAGSALGTFIILYLSKFLPDV